MEGWQLNRSENMLYQVRIYGQIGARQERLFWSQTPPSLRIEVFCVVRFFRREHSLAWCHCHGFLIFGNKRLAFRKISSVAKWLNQAFLLCQSFEVPAVRETVHLTGAGGLSFSWTSNTELQASVRVNSIWHNSQSYAYWQRDISWFSSLQEDGERWLSWNSREIQDWSPVSVQWTTKFYMMLQSLCSWPMVKHFFYKNVSSRRLPYRF